MKKRKPIFFLIFSILAFLISLASYENHQHNAKSDLEGQYDYIATYEEGSRAGSQTTGHRVTVQSLPNGEDQLVWGELKVKASRVANGLIYKWQLGAYSGEGIYMFYDKGQKLFGTFRLKDQMGDQTGYTQGTKIKVPAR